MATVAVDITSDNRLYVEDDFGLWDGNYVVTDRVSDELLASSYIRFKAEGLLPYIFYENVTPPGLTWFMEQFSMKMEVLACLREDPGKKFSLGGFCWLLSKTKVGGVFTKAEVGQAFFREFHNRRETVRWAKLATHYAFTDLGCDVLVGTTPVNNRAAIVAAKRTGFTVIGELPMYTLWAGEPATVAVSYLTKDQWMGEYGRRG